MNCTTHHPACNCRESYFLQLNDQFADVSNMLKAVVLLLNNRAEHEKIKELLRESLQRHDTLNASDYYL
jgi:hypothetical protein